MLLIPKQLPFRWVRLFVPGGRARGSKPRAAPQIFDNLSSPHDTRGEIQLPGQVTARLPGSGHPPIQPKWDGAPARRC